MMEKMIGAVIGHFSFTDDKERRFFQKDKTSVQCGIFIVRTVQYKISGEDNKVSIGIINHRNHSVFKYIDGIHDVANRYKRKILFGLQQIRDFRGISGIDPYKLRILNRNENFKNKNTEIDY
jgi:hypothetical protein